MYKLAKKMCKRMTSDSSTIYNYHMNLFVFSLVADYWGVGQLFPMMPVSRLDERPTLRGTHVDITCDSDGKINKFIGSVETLPLHPRPGARRLLCGRAPIRVVAGGTGLQAQPVQRPDPRGRRGWQRRQRRLQGRIRRDGPDDGGDHGHHEV
ncbi:hypothetical protein PVAP13_6KG144512 [Panicum virgatum]|uniref:Arginine decarboxylase n=1 Tax=Panicum virgatum TaxID=38727 RepID=A0A8T0RDN0_PANVG|nr:hypothetical protein PVAP13_6KG144512 [Panicum virgatum]